MTSPERIHLSSYFKGHKLSAVKSENAATQMPTVDPYLYDVWLSWRISQTVEVIIRMSYAIHPSKLHFIKGVLE